MKYVFFGTPQFAVNILEQLLHAGLPPTLIVTQPPRPKGRKLVLTPSPVAVWARAHNIPVREPEKLVGNNDLLKELRDEHADCFVVAAYGKILRQEVLDIPAHGVLNVHPSLLPKFRGPSPIESFILSSETETGVSIMLLDSELDHGPIIAQETVSLPYQPMRGSELEELMAKRGGALLARMLPDWITGKITPTEQDHQQATFTRKTEKKDGELTVDMPAELQLKKIRAYDGWPGAYFFHEYKGNSLRIKVLDATLDGQGNIVYQKVLPEGGSEMSYQDFLRGYPSTQQ